MNRYADIEEGYYSHEIAAAREAVGSDALAGIGYADAYRYALRAARVAFRMARG